MRIIGFLFLLCFLLSTSSYGQIALKVGQFRPLGYMGFAMKKGLTYELAFLPDFDSRFRLRASFSFTSLKPRQDTLHYIGILEQDGMTTITPGYLIYQRYLMGYLSIGGDFAMVHKEPFFLYAGLDVIGGVTSSKTEDVNIMVSSKQEGESQGVMGGRLRLGAEYFIGDSFSVLAEAMRAAYVLYPVGYFGHNDYALGVKYRF